MAKITGRGTINMEKVQGIYNFALIKELQQMVADGRIDFRKGIEKGLPEWHFTFNGFFVDKIDCGFKMHPTETEIDSTNHKWFDTEHLWLVHIGSRLKGIGNHYYRTHEEDFFIYKKNWEIQYDLLYKEELKIAKFFEVEFKNYKKAKHMAELFVELVKLLRSDDYRYGYITL